jgi:hypothetical protein
VTAAEQIALSAAHAAWVGAMASGCASVVALGIALFGATREEDRRRRVVKEQETAFCFAMVGAFELIKPLVLEARRDPGGETGRMRFSGMVEHARTIAEAGLSAPVYDLQLLRDAYRLWGVLNALGALPEEHGRTVPYAAVIELIAPSLSELIDADDRFFAHISKFDTIKGVNGRTSIPRSFDSAA